ncbi:MAG: transcription initiation factor IIB family protein [Promethearchaeota archaeon]
MLLAIKDRCETICRKCRLIIYDKKFDNFQNDEKPFNENERTKRGISEVPISYSFSEIEQNIHSISKEIYNTDLRRANKKGSYMNWKKKNLIIAITELKRLASILNLPNYITELAFYFYKKSFEKKLVKGRSIKSMVAACTYFACRTKNIPITYSEILKESTEPKKMLKSCYRSLVSMFNLKIPYMNPISFIPKYISKLNLNFEIEKLTIRILNSYLKNEIIDGKNPKGICAGALYLASKLKNYRINQKEICKIIGVTEITLRSRYKEIMNTIDMTLY